MKLRGLMGLVSLAFLAVLLAGTPATASEDQMPPAAITCMGCHGIPGYFNVYPTYNVPRLGGQHAEYLVAALKAYRLGQRSHPTMGAQANTLSDQDIADIAAFFSKNKGP